MEIKQAPETRLITRPGSFYTARVSAAVPGVGISWINQDFNADLGHTTIISIELLGSSFMTGVSWGTWNANRSWVVYHRTNPGRAQVHMDGTINYTWNLIAGGLRATFIQGLIMNNGRLQADNDIW